MVNVLEGESLVNDATALVDLQGRRRRRDRGERLDRAHPGSTFFVRRGGGSGDRAGGRLGDRRGPQADHRRQHRADDLAVQRLRRLHPRGPARGLRRPRRGLRRTGPRLPRSGDRLAREPDAGLRPLVDPHVPAQRHPVHPDRAAAADDRGGAQRQTGRRGPRLRGDRLRCGDRAAVHLEQRHDGGDPDARSAPLAAGSARNLAAASDRQLGRDARCGFARRGAGTAPADECRRPAARPRPDPVHHLLADPGDGGWAGTDPALADPQAGRGGGRRRGGERGDQGQAGDREGRARSGRRARGRGLDARRHHRARPSPLPVSEAAVCGSCRQDRGRATASRRARSPTSG